MSILIQTFTQNSKSPNLGEETEGVAIAVNAQESTFIINGICRVSKKTAEKLSDTILHNVSIVCTYGSNLLPVVFPIIRDHVVFSDDINTSGDYHTAFFNIDLNSSGIPDKQGKYFITAFFHIFFSKTIEINWNR